MGKIEKANAQLVDNRYLMSVYSVMIFSIFGYEFTHYENMNTLLLIITTSTLIALLIGFVILSKRNKKIINELEFL